MTDHEVVEYAQKATAHITDGQVATVRNALTPSPYRFTVSVEGPCVKFVDPCTASRRVWRFDTEAEARSHAALVLAALHQATMEET